jgi:ribosomal protein S18 acetylase RimI-like enzyme
MNRPAPPIKLVPVLASEAAAVRAMAESIWPEAYRDIIPPEQIRYMLDRMYALPSLTAQLDSPEHRFFWIEAESVRRGFLAVELAASDASAQLHKLYLLTAQQGKGYGSAAWQALEGILQATGCRRVTLRVNRLNAPAIGCYQKCGLTIQTSDCRDIGAGFVMDDHIFEKTL